MGGVFAQRDDASTPLALEDLAGLIPAHIAYRSELNEAEQDNILRGQEWAFARRRDLLNEKFIRDLHGRMFGDVWRWAGKFRTSERNMGIPFWRIPVELRSLLDDTRTWIACESYAADEIGVRFHHRLVQIHPFPNGNGRHSRMMADLLVMQLGRDRFSWGRESLVVAGGVRAQYIAALRAADDHDVEPLLAFARG